MKIILIVVLTAITNTLSAQTKLKTISDFVPKGFVIHEKIVGDLNKDGVNDCVIIIKATDKSKTVNHEYRGKLDRNRRGLIVLLNKKNQHQLAAQNLTCFSSENEEGGVYFAPELTVEIKKGNLYIQYGHGRYGYCAYTFRYQNSDFELIGYDESNGGSVISSTRSVNFLTNKEISRENTNMDAESGEEVFRTTVTKIQPRKLVRLSGIKDFDELDV